MKFPGCGEMIVQGGISCQVKAVDPDTQVGGGGNKQETIGLLLAVIIFFRNRGRVAWPCWSPWNGSFTGPMHPRMQLNVHCFH